MKKTLIYLMAIPCLFLSCIKDEGSTDYRDVNRVELALPAEVSVIMEPRTVTLTPELSQTLSRNMDNLTFEWLRSYVTPNLMGFDDAEAEVIGTGETLDIEVTGTETKFVQYIRLNVYDKLTGLTYPANVKLSLIKPYTGAWMVLHENNGVARLGAIEYAGVPVITPDAYNKETGKQFVGKPVALLGIPGFSYYAYGYGNNHKIFGVVTDNPDESGIFVQWDKFRQQQSLRQLLSPIASTGFDFSSFKAGVGSGSDYGFTIMSGGQLYQCQVGMKIYKAHPGSVGDVNITHTAKFGFFSLLYDALKRRFLTYYNPAREANYNHLVFDEAKDNPASAFMESIPSRENNATGANPNALPADRQVLYLGPGLKYDPRNSNATYAYAVAKAGSMCYVYEFNSFGFARGTEPTFSGYTEVPAPSGLNENSRFATTDLYSGLIYYTSGSTVYRWDFKAGEGTATPIYTNENGGTAVKMTFARSTTDSRMNPGGILAVPGYEFNPMYSLAVCFNLPDGTGEVAIINLSTSGRPGDDSAHYPAVQTHRGFGPITDIVFI